jgi:hypothetical protein
MRRKLVRCVTMAAGVSIAGAAIPIAAAFTAWADTEITYDGKIIYDDFPGMHQFLSSDVGTAALSGTNNDWALVTGPASDNVVGLANDSAATDSNDFALYSGTTAPVGLFGDEPAGFSGDEGASITNATNSSAEVFGDGNAIIIAGNNSNAIAANRGTVLISTDGNGPGLTTSPMTDDFAFANGTATGSGPLAGTSTVAEILDSNNSVAIANNTGFNPTNFEGGSAIELANNSFAYATNAGSAANIEGGVVNGVALSGGVVNGAALSNDIPITNVSNIEPDGDIFTAMTSNTGVIDGIPDATFFADLLGAHGAATASADFTILLQAFGL